MIVIWALDDDLRLCWVNFAACRFCCSAEFGAEEGNRLLDDANVVQERSCFLRVVDGRCWDFQCENRDVVVGVRNMLVIDQFGVSWELGGGYQLVVQLGEDVIVNAPEFRAER